jgi:hypothetical protein
MGHYVNGLKVKNTGSIPAGIKDLSFSSEVHRESHSPDNEASFPWF